MTRQELIQRVSLGVQRDDLNAYYGDFVNEAIKFYQQLRNWTWMHGLLNTEIPEGQMSVALPPSFKDFDDSEINVFVLSPNDPSGIVRFPCKVEFRSQFLAKLARRHYFTPFYPPYATWQRGFPMWRDDFNGVTVLGLPGNAQTNLQFEISCYQFTPPLEKDTDTNWMTMYFENMIIDKAKAIALASVNDPVAAGFAASADDYFKKAAGKDEEKRLRGQVLKMGRGARV